MKYSQVHQGGRQFAKEKSLPFPLNLLGEDSKGGTPPEPSKDPEKEIRHRGGVTKENHRRCREKGYSTQKERNDRGR